MPVIPDAWRQKHPSRMFYNLERDVETEFGRIRLLNGKATQGRTVWGTYGSVQPLTDGLEEAYDKAWEEGRLKLLNLGDCALINAFDEGLMRPDLYKHFALEDRNPFEVCRADGLEWVENHEGDMVAPGQQEVAGHLLYDRSWLTMKRLAKLYTSVDRAGFMEGLEMA